MIYYLIKNENNIITLSFSEPEDPRQECYGFDDFKLIPTKYYPYQGISSCEEINKIISSFYLNEILPYFGKQEGDIIAPLDFDDEKEFFNKIIDALKSNSPEINLLVEYSCTPCYPYIETSEEFKLMTNYLAYFYRSSSYRGNIYYQNKKYTKDGENANALGLFSIKNDVIFNIIKYCVDNSLEIELLETILSYSKIETFEDFKKNLDTLNIKDNFDIPIALFMLLSKNAKTNDKKVLADYINNYLSLNDSEKLEIIRSCKDNVGYRNDIYLLYEDNYKILIDYAEKCFSQIQESKIYLPGDCEYYSAVIIDQNLAMKFENDELLILSFCKGNINRGPGINKEDEDKLTCYINTCHGDNACQEILYEKCKDVCNNLVLNYDSDDDQEEVNKNLNKKLKLDKELQNLGYDGLQDFLEKYDKNINNDILHKYMDDIENILLNGYFSYELKVLVAKKNLFLDQLLENKEYCVLLDSHKLLNRILYCNDEMARYRLADLGYGLDILKQDTDSFVVKCVYRWLGQHNMTIGEYIKRVKNEGYDWIFDL